MRQQFALTNQIIGPYRLTQLNGKCEDVGETAIMDIEECIKATTALKIAIPDPQNHAGVWGRHSSGTEYTWHGYSLIPENSPPGCIHELRTIPYTIANRPDRYPFPWLNDNKNGKRNPRFQSVCKRTGTRSNILFFIILI